MRTCHAVGWTLWVTAIVVVLVSFFAGAIAYPHDKTTPLPVVWCMWCGLGLLASAIIAFIYEWVTAHVRVV